MTLSQCVFVWVRKCVRVDGFAQFSMILRLCSWSCSPYLCVFLGELWMCSHVDFVMLHMTACMVVDLVFCVHLVGMCLAAGDCALCCACFICVCQVPYSCVFACVHICCIQ